MGQHKVKEKQEQAIVAFKEEIRNRLLADDVTFDDFQKLDGADPYKELVSLNDVTCCIWLDILALKDKYLKSVDNNLIMLNNAIQEVFNELSDIISEKMSKLPVPYDDRFLSEIADEEHATIETAKYYKRVINTGLECSKVYNLQTLQMIGDKHGYVCETLIGYNVKRLIHKQIGRIKVKDLIA